MKDYMSILQQLFLVTAGASLGPDITPNAFSFASIDNAQVSSVYTSDAVTLSGMNSSTTATCTNATMNVNGGLFSASKTVNNGDVIRLRVTSSATYGTGDTVGSVNIGGTVGTFSVTNATGTDMAWSLQVGAVPNTIDRNTITTTNANFGVFIASNALVPRDGLYYYVELASNVGGLQLFTQTAAQQASGTFTAFDPTTTALSMIVQWTGSQYRIWRYRRNDGSQINGRTTTGTQVAAYIAYQMQQAATQTVIPNASGWVLPYAGAFTRTALYPG